MKQKTEVLTIRVTPGMALQLKREVGLHGSVSSLARTILEQYFKAKARALGRTEGGKL